eukprot:875070_1
MSQPPLEFSLSDEVIRTIGQMHAKTLWRSHKYDNYGHGFYADSKPKNVHKTVKTHHKQRQNEEINVWDGALDIEEEEEQEELEEDYTINEHIANTIVIDRRMCGNRKESTNNKGSSEYMHEMTSDLWHIKQQLQMM